MLPKSESEVTTPVEVIASTPEVATRNYVEDFKKLVVEKDPQKKLVDLEFAALVAYYFIHLAPEEKMVNEINPSHLQEGFRLADRRPPKDPKATLRNAKNSRGFLESGKDAGTFKLTPAGEYFVKHDLPKKSK